MVYFLTVELNCNLKYQSVIAAFNSNQNFKIEIDWISGICKYSAVLVTCNSTWNSLRCIEIMNQVKTVKIFTCLNYSVTRKLSDILIKYFWQIISFNFFYRARVDQYQNTDFTVQPVKPVYSLSDAGWVQYCESADCCGISKFRKIWQVLGSFHPARNNIKG